MTRRRRGAREGEMWRRRLCRNTKNLDNFKLFYSFITTVRKA